MLMHKIFQTNHFDAENYGIFGYRVNVTSCADANGLAPRHKTTVPGGKRGREMLFLHD